jgi:hypothetical protein
MIDCHAHASPPSHTRTVDVRPPASDTVHVTVAIPDPFLVLRSGDDREESLEYIGLQVEALVMMFGRSFLPKGARDKGHGVVEYVWVEKVGENAATVVIVEDADMPARYLYVSSNDPRHAHEIWKNLEYRLPIVPVKKLLLQASKPGRFRGALSRLALSTTGKEREEVTALVAKGLGSRNADVRMDAAQATVILGWPRFAPHLETAAGRERNADARSALIHALEKVRPGTRH